ncbi:unnamed protein product [Amoebophrya sp. A120]|nr:unnamed protein product [Amoebophrya sp. A120]|eukprot:GSA120T00013483001.1
MPLQWKSKFARIGAATASTVSLLGGGGAFFVGAAKISPTSTHAWVGSETSPSGFVDVNHGHRKKSRVFDKEKRKTKTKTRSTKASLAARVGRDDDAVKVVNAGAKLGQAGIQVVQIPDAVGVAGDAAAGIVGGFADTVGDVVSFVDDAVQFVPNAVKGFSEAYGWHL